jgi:hypothetical protein
MGRRRKYIKRKEKAEELKHKEEENEMKKETDPSLTSACLQQR